MRLITLLSLNDLSDEPQNAFLKTFASRPREKRKAFAAVRRTGLSWLTAKLQRLLAGLQTCWFSDIGEDFMKQPLTPKKVMAMGEQWFSTYLAQFPVEERLKLVGLSPNERLMGVWKTRKECFYQTFFILHHFRLVQNFWFIGLFVFGM